MSEEDSLIPTLAVREQYRDEYWRKRDPIADDRLLWRAQTFRHTVHLLPGQTILELGCGELRLTRALLRVSRGENPITAVTFQNTPPTASHLDGRVEVLQLRELPGRLANRRFDCIVAMDLLDRSNSSELLGIVHELLAPAGEMVFYESNPWNPVHKLRLMLLRFAGKKDPRNLLNQPSLYELLSELGFVRIYAVFNDFVFAPLTRRLIWFLRNLSILLENAPIVRRLAGSILIHAQKPPLRKKLPNVSLFVHESLRRTISIVIPSHNEEMNIRPLVEHILTLYGEYVHEIIPVNDGSTDRTAEVMRELAAEDDRVKPLHRTPPNGVGLAIRDGLAAATGRYVLTMDCDFQHLLPEFRDLLDAAAEGYDVVIGSRFSRHSVLLNYPFLKIFANRAFHAIAVVLFGRRIRDVTNNLKIMRREVVQDLRLRQRGFAVNAETGLQPLVLGYNVEQVPISWINRTPGMGVSSFRLANVGGGYWNVLFGLWLRQMFGVGPYRSLSRQHSVTHAEPESLRADRVWARCKLHDSQLLVSLKQDVKPATPSDTARRSNRRTSFGGTSARRRDWICCGLILLVWLALWTPRLRGPINFRWDASTYYVLGTALAEGKGYRLLNEPGEIHAVQYPPLLPMFVAALQRTMGTQDFFKVGCALRLAYLIFSALFLWMSYTLARQMFSPAQSLMVGTITALSFSSFIGPSDVFYADMLFALVAMAFLVTQQKSDRPLLAVASGVLAIAAYLLRTAGIALLLAWIAESVLRRRFRQAALRAAVSALPVLLWQGYVWKVTHGDEYQHPAYSYQRAAYNYPNVTYGENSRLVAPFQPELGDMRANDLVRRLARNVVEVPTALGESAIVPRWSVSFLSRGPRSLHLPMSHQCSQVLSAGLYSGLFAVGLLALIGALLVANGARWFLTLYFVIALGIVVITPWQDQFSRYLASMTPLTLIFLFVTVSALGNWVDSFDFRPRKTAGVLVTIVPVVTILVVQTALAVHVFRARTPVSYYDATGQERVFRLLEYGSEWHALDPAFQWIRSHAPADAVIATTVPHLAYLRTQRKAVLPPFELDPNKAIHLLDEVPVSYLVLDHFKRPGISERYAAPLIAANPTNWQSVFTAPDGKTKVYERNR